MAVCIAAIGAVVSSAARYRRVAELQKQLEESQAQLDSMRGSLAQYETAMREIEDKNRELRGVIDTAADGIICIDENGIVESVNPAALKLLGYDREAFIGKNVVEFLPDQYRQRFGAALTYYFRSAMKGMVGRVAEAAGQRRDGTEFPMEVSVSHLSFGERALYTAFIRDISDRKKAEKRVSEFYSTISHELRSPLSSIRGSLGLIEGGAIGEVSDDVLELLQIAKRNCDRLIRLINDILDAKKIEAGKLQVRKMPLRADDLVRNAVEVMQTLATEARVDLRADDVLQAEVIGDPDRVVQVLTNLLSNAIKHSPEGEAIEVFTGEALNGREFLRFCVRDRGPGIPSDQLDLLFSEFQQLDSSDSRKLGGTGLGLAISKSIVEQLDGQIGVENSPGKGATFWFELPLHQM
jgi:PAS domain S-box-containing protein